jgi:hypothetical protein
MSNFFPDEKARQTAFIKILEKYHIYITPSEVVGTSFCTDGDMRCHGFPYCYCEIKLEVGATGAEPIFQMALYYTAQLKSKMPLSRHSVYPCLGLYLVGEFLLEGSNSCANTFCRPDTWLCGLSLD